MDMDMDMVSKAAVTCEHESKSQPESTRAKVTNKAPGKREGKSANLESTKMWEFLPF
jgi:hypothetical protein